jgi:hypothetical protein
MDKKQALQILSGHAKWRRGADIPQTDPKALGLALDVTIRALSSEVETSDAQAVSDRMLLARFKAFCEAEFLLAIPHRVVQEYLEYTASEKAVGA